MGINDVMFFVKKNVPTHSDAQEYILLVYGMERLVGYSKSLTA